MIRSEMMEKLTKEQIDAKLAKLRESRLDDETYTVVRPAMAMCYSMEFPRRITQICQCASCGKDFEVSWVRGESLSPETGEDIAAQFRSAGMDAQFCCHCPDCVQKHGAAPYEMHIKAKDEQEWHVSIPEENTWYRRKENSTSLFEYELALRFLTFPEKINDLAGFFDKLYNQEFREKELAFFVGQECIDRQPAPQAISDWEKRRVQEKAVLQDPKLFCSGKPPVDFYAVPDLTVPSALELIKRHIDFCNDDGEHDFIFYRFVTLLGNQYRVLTYRGINGATDDICAKAGFIKTQVDLALFKVLGLTVVYDLEEMRRNIDLTWKENNRQGLLPFAYASLEKTGKTQFTVKEYVDFMDRMQQILKPVEQALDAVGKMIYSEITRSNVLIDYMSEVMQTWMVRQKRVNFTKEEIRSYLHGDLFPNVRFDFKTVKKAFQKWTVPNEPWDYYGLDNESPKEVLQRLKGNFFAPLYQRTGQSLSLQDIVDVQDEINRIFNTYGLPVHISIVFGTGKVQ